MLKWPAAASNRPVCHLCELGLPSKLRESSQTEQAIAATILLVLFVR